jgi:parallel beta-helix repeat protein
MLSRKLTGTLGAGLLALGVAAPAHAATFTVNNTNNNGAGSLRSAMNAAEGTAAADTIKFAIPGAGVHTIAPTNPLPVLTRPVTIKGYSQPGATEATPTTAADLKIVIDAVNVGRGLEIGGDGIEVRGLDIQRAQSDGVYVEGSDNVIAGNHIGTGVNGAVARPNAEYGVHVFATGNQIGGPDAKDRNVISGNGLGEVYVESGTGHVVEGNRLGLTADGTGDLGTSVGVQLEASDNEVLDNQIAGELDGVNVTDDDNVVQGNQIGLDVNGAALPNFVGLNVLGGDGNTIEDNVLSGNDASALQLSPDSSGDAAKSNDVKDNMIGVNAAGDATVPNGGFAGLAGVVVLSSSGNTLEGNVIGGNAGPGVKITGDGADGNRLLGNWIGTDTAAALELGNDGRGVDIDGGDNNVVGDAGSSSGSNTITHNGGDGVSVVSGTGNAVVRNSITGNHDLAVDLADDGSTANDPNDADAGPNELQNGPEIGSATATDVDWSLESLPTTQYRLEFYANDTCDGASRTEAQTFLGSTVVTTDANGNADGDTSITLPAGAGSFVSMTATRLQLAIVGPGFPPPLALVPRSTSEVSPCEAVA